MQRLVMLSLAVGSWSVPRVAQALDGTECALYPIAMHVDSLDAILEDPDLEIDILEGAGSGNFGWLRWTEHSEVLSADTNSEEYLAEELLDPGLASIDYREPEHKDSYDVHIETGDWVWGLTGRVSSASVVGDALEWLVWDERPILVPLWDVSEDSGSNAVYHVVGFVRVRITGFALGGGDAAISAVFHSLEHEACLGDGH